MKIIKKINPPVGFELDIEASTKNEVVFKKVPDLKEAEKLFIEIITGMEFYPQQIRPNSVFWKKYDKIIFEQDIDKDIIWYDYYTIGKSFEHYLNNDEKITDFIQDMIKKHLKWVGFKTEKTLCRWSKIYENTNIR
jgi:hypothetical protein